MLTITKTKTPLKSNKVKLKALGPKQIITKIESAKVLILFLTQTDDEN